MKNTHFTYEMMVTLWDVQVILGLRVSGPLVADNFRIALDPIMLPELGPRLLGHTPFHERHEISGMKVSLSR